MLILTNKLQQKLKKRISQHNRNCMKINPYLTKVLTRKHICMWVCRFVIISGFLIQISTTWLLSFFYYCKIFDKKSENMHFSHIRTRVWSARSHGVRNEAGRQEGSTMNLTLMHIPAIKLSEWGIIFIILVVCCWLLMEPMPTDKIFCVNIFWGFHSSGCGYAKAWKKDECVTIKNIVKIIC